MRRLLVDLNVVLDVILDRKDAPIAARLWAAIETGKGTGILPAHGLTTIHYLVARARGPAFARRAIDGLLHVFEVAPVDERVLRRAVALGWSDFEDAVCAATAEMARCDAIVTRDPKGFAASPTRPIDPATALAWLVASK
jgi:predicted nucleic acid-binding protein